MSLLKSTATIGVYTLISRVLGFVRDMTIASGLGASMLSDAFLVAFKLPNFLRRLFAEGAFNSAFVPQYAGMMATEGGDKAKRFASEAMSFLLLVLFIVSGVLIAAMPWFMHILAPGFASNPEKFDLTIALTRITMPYILFISLVSLLGGILNSSGKFAAVAATPIIMNLCLIIIPFLIEDLTPNGAYALAIAVMVSGVLQWLWLVYFCAKQGLLPKLQRPRLSPDVKKLMLLMAPVALGAGVAQINLVVDMILASYFGHGVSYLYFADRINELPLAVIGIALGTALLPMLSKQIREGKREEAYASQNRALELGLFLSLPAAVAIAMMAQPIITVMFERGAFSEHDTLQTYRALVAFSLGLPAFILIKILAPGFFANEDTKTPFKIATLCVVLNLVLNLILMIPLAHVGMALATSIAAWVNVLLMLMILKKREWLRVMPELPRELAKIMLGCALMAACLWYLAPWLTSKLHLGEIERAPALMAVVIAGSAGYFATAFALNTLGLRRWLRKKT
jgi:putative peptidoglycan lipid II flippase